MKKILAVVCLVISSILLSAYFDKQPLGQVTLKEKEMNGLYTKAYASFEDLSCLESSSRYDSELGPVRLVNVNEDGEPFIFVSNAMSFLTEGQEYDIRESKETIIYNGETHQVYYLQAPDFRYIIYAVLSGICIFSFAAFLMWDRVEENQKNHQKVSE